MPALLHVAPRSAEQAKSARVERTGSYHNRYRPIESGRGWDVSRGGRGAQAD
ncbi:hypothetical protein D3C85_782210 [compost metagenome]